ncbi:hypothetical protein QE152_g34796 [Popillia japonica]|uniref:DUF4219 domain-containing protein n=1 Tax=Popillia japonica TaxID=7064 RepID=A0AAW1ITF3_POPJA
MAKAEKKNTFNIDILTSNNYHTWKFRMITLMQEKEVKEFIENEFKEENYTNETKKVEARKGDNKCKSYIVQCLDDTQIELIRNKTTAYSMWKSLEERHEKKGVPGQMLLRKKLMNMKLKEVIPDRCS